MHSSDRNLVKERRIYLKKLKKLFIITGVVFIILVLQFCVFYNSVVATQLDSANIYMVGDCGSLLRYKGVEVKVSYVQYTYEGVNYPAYCLDKTKPGAENGAYTVSVNSMIQDVGLWRRIINGYPYKSLEELGVANKEEAFTATKQAIYCYIHGNNPADYTPIGEAGERTLRAMHQIIAQAQSSSETKISNYIEIKDEDANWKVDEIEKSYISKVFSILSDAQIQDYSIHFQENTIDGIKITNLQNTVKNEFQPDEKFKILIPIESLREKGEFRILANAKVKTKPVLYGTAPDSGLQDYALTAATYEDGVGEISLQYPKNETEIIVIKQDEESNERLKNVEFALLNENKEVIKQGLLTDEEGKIQISNLLPGKYYLKEVHTSLGYIPTEELIELEVEWNDSLTVTVYNQKEKKPEIKTEKNETVKQVKKLPVTGM
mgnify:FL=1